MAVDGRPVTPAGNDSPYVSSIGRTPAEIPVRSCIKLNSTATVIRYTMSPVQKKPSVRFSSPPESSALFQLSQPEYWAVRYFQEHVDRCHICAPPYARLCLVGLSHAGSIDSYMFLNRSRQVVSTTSREIWLEIPKQFPSVRVLLGTLRYELPKEASRERSGRRYAGAHYREKAGGKRGYIYVYK